MTDLNFQLICGYRAGPPNYALFRPDDFVMVRVHHVRLGRADTGDQSVQGLQLSAIWNGKKEYSKSVRKVISERNSEVNT